MININTKIGLDGEYKIVVLRNDNVHYESDWFSNLILDNGLNYLGSDNNVVATRYCRVGTGTTPVAPNQLNLVNQLANAEYSTTDIINLGAAEDYASLLTYQYNFTQGSMLTTITEAGVGWDSIGNTLFSRVLLPTPITLTSVDQLIMYYRVRIEPPITDVTGSLTIASTSYDFTSRVALVENFGLSADCLTPLRFSRMVSVQSYDDSAALGPITGNLTASGGGDSASSYVYQTYITGSKTRTTTATFLPSVSNYTGGILGFRMAAETTGSGNLFNWQMLLDNPIPKTNMDLFTITFRFGWDRL
jgi:hypothetical protein